ncbi:glycoside hydrolase family 97 catalytic domain-containing protein [Paraglaciecola arctica]|uniref:Alpha-glucosidase n=1 Tax=Paraglaciecola arctica BSs20135 TaxID=493475 RepID=K6Y8W5_9ALTE|nr:glycoside hydrolase family 97 catalytic domain-containing protein [Paraglaciecola arctica]GAC20361.1 hypothetical protein GARC_3403 [Paraglaciecola arctica BSs20135]
MTNQSSKTLKIWGLLVILSIVLLSAGLLLNDNEKQYATVSSPDSGIRLEFKVISGKPHYRVFNQNVEIISYSALGFDFNDQEPLKNNLQVTDTVISEFKEQWQRPWGQSKTALNHYQQLTITLDEKSSLQRQLIIEFRVFNDGLGFRYQLPEQPNLQQFEITSENTEFSLVGDPTSWWIPQDFESYESQYRETPLSKVEAVNTPITMQNEEGTFISIHEAALTNYAGMTLKKSVLNNTLVSDLVPWPDGIKVKGQTPFQTPWRTIQLAKTAGDLITSDLIENLNEANMLENASWITPMKYIGIWWGMHMRQYTWEAGPKHGATTANTKEYIDFASSHGIKGVLVEGWNKGWETWHTGLNVQDFTQAYDDFDLKAVTEYAKSKGVDLIGHHETGGNIPMYEEQIEQAFQLYNQMGVTAIKTGYAGKMTPEGVHHHGQQMVNHYRMVLELAAKYKIMLNVHEPIKPTGIRRTYPNMMTREAGRGMEWNGWSDGNSPEHTLMLPFTRLLAGPMDYTPGIFNIQFDPQKQYRVHTTLARQLAHFVTLYSPMQMASDMIENYQNQAAFTFIEKVPTDWDETLVINAEIGDFLTIVRRNNNSWFIGSMTDEDPRELSIPLHFLGQGQEYIATIYADAKDTDFVNNPTAIEITQVLVKKGDVIPAVMTSGGGQAIAIEPITAANQLHLPQIRDYQQQVKGRFAEFEQGSRYGEINKVQHLAVNKEIILNTEYDAGYSGGGMSALVDGIRGNPDYKTLWQGYRMQDLDVTIDLQQQQLVKQIDIGFLQSILHSILLPSEVHFQISTDGHNYLTVGQSEYSTQKGQPDFQIKNFSASFSAQPVRYIKVTAKNINALPDWHIRPGQESFIFSDEIQVH